MSARDCLRIVVIAPLRFPIRPPHPGGLESAVWSEVTALRRRGHEVALVAVAGSDFVKPGSPFELPVLDWPAGMLRSDVSYPHSYEATTVPALEHALAAIAAEPDRFDVISNHCLHPLPIQRASMLGVPMLTTLHTPPDDEVIAAHTAAGPTGSRFVAVSDFTRREWARAGLLLRAFGERRRSLRVAGGHGRGAPCVVREDSAGEGAAPRCRGRAATRQTPDDRRAHRRPRLRRRRHRSPCSTLTSPTSDLWRRHLSLNWWAGARQPCPHRPGPSRSVLSRPRR